MVDVIFSLFGPAYFGYHHTPYGAVVIWAAASAAVFFWRNKESLRHARRQAYGADSVPNAYTLFVTLLLLIAIGVVYLAVHSALYFFVAKVA